MNVVPESLRLNGLIDFGWGRKHLRILGSQTIVIVVLAVALGFHIFMAWRQNEQVFKLLESHSTQMTAITQQHEQQSKLSERTTDEFIFLLAAPPSERERLYRGMQVPERFQRLR